MPFSSWSFFHCHRYLRRFRLSVHWDNVERQYPPETQANKEAVERFACEGVDSFWGKEPSDSRMNLHGQNLNKSMRMIVKPRWLALQEQGNAFRQSLSPGILFRKEIANTHTFSDESKLWHSLEQWTLLKCL